MGRALPASVDHRLRGTRLQLGKQDQVLRKAVSPAEGRLAAGTLLRGVPVGRCCSLISLCSRISARPSGRPYFAACQEVMLQLMRVAMPGRQFPHGLLLTPPGAFPPVLPYARRPTTCAAQRRTARSPAAQPPIGAGSGTQGALPLKHAAVLWSRGRSMGPGRLRMTQGLLDRPALSERPALDSSRIPGARPRGPARGSGRAVLLPLTGPPSLLGPSKTRPPDDMPVHGGFQNAGRRPLLGIGATQPQAHKAAGA